MHTHLAPLLGTLAGDTTGYRLLLVGHLLCVIVGFGSTFVYPFLGVEAERRKGVEGAAITNSVIKTAHIVTTPSSTRLARSACFS
jgi:hypothetical protein